MAQQHLDRLTALDTSFLTQETDNAHMHVGAMALFRGPALSLDAFLEHIEKRLHLVPRYRQKLYFPPFETGRPLWIDDPNFNLEYHIRHTALPSPGSEDQLRRLTARIFSQRLDRSKPLWEAWLVDGVEGDRFAMIFKTHHALVDGVSGVDLATVLFDLTPEPREVPPPDEPWQPRPEPSRAELAAVGVKGLVGMGKEVVGTAASAVTKPTRALSTIRDAAAGIGEVAWAGMNPAPETPLNVPIGPHRRFVYARTQLSDYKTVKNTLGGTVNDVVLTVVAGALARWLRSRGIRTEGLELSAQVPVSVRSESEHGQLGNKLAVMRGPLPVYIQDPVNRLEVVRKAMQGLKESKQAVGAKAISNMEDFAPPTVLAQASRLNFSTRFFNVVVTNVPGPQFPLYILGHEMLDIMPVGFLPKNHALFVAIMSYNGKVNYGLLGDFDALPDIEVIAQAVEDSLAELVRAAGGETTPEASDDGKLVGVETVSTSRPSKSSGTARKRATAKTGSAKKTASKSRSSSAKKSSGSKARATASSRSKAGSSGSGSSNGAGGNGDAS